MLDFLSSIVLVKAPEVTVVTDKKISKQEVNPSNGADLRLFKDGRLYPSEALITECNLEYTDKDKDKGNGFDIFGTDVWNEYPKNAPQHVVLISPVNKSLTKVSAFDKTRYNVAGNPISSVKDQGASTFGKELIDTLRRVYTLPVVEVSETETVDPLFGTGNFVDLKIMRNIPVTSPDNIYHIPKPVKKGVDAGTMEHIRRENLTLRPLVIYTAELEAQYKAEQEALKNSTSSDVVSE